MADNDNERQEEDNVLRSLRRNQEDPSLRRRFQNPQAQQPNGLNDQRDLSPTVSAGFLNGGWTTVWFIVSLFALVCLSMLCLHLYHNYIGAGKATVVECAIAEKSYETCQGQLEICNTNKRLKNEKIRSSSQKYETCQEGLHTCNADKQYCDEKIITATRGYRTCQERLDICSASERQNSEKVYSATQGHEACKKQLEICNKRYSKEKNHSKNQNEKLMDKSDECNLVKNDLSSCETSKYYHFILLAGTWLCIFIYFCGSCLYIRQLTTVVNNQQLALTAEKTK